MTHLLGFVAALVRWLRRSSAEREAEIVYLGQQLIVLKWTAPARPRLKATDRLIFEGILEGTQPATLRLADLEAPFSIDWNEQRAAFGFMAKHGP
jgi:hypothetical protein